MTEPATKADPKHGSHAERRQAEPAKKKMMKFQVISGAFIHNEPRGECYYAATRSDQGMVIPSPVFESDQDLVQKFGSEKFFRVPDDTYTGPKELLRQEGESLEDFGKRILEMAQADAAQRKAVAQARVQSTDPNANLTHPPVNPVAPAPPVPPPPPQPPPNLDSLSLDQLKQLAADEEVELHGAKDKATVVKHLRAAGKGK